MLLPPWGLLGLKAVCVTSSIFMMFSGVPDMIAIVRAKPTADRSRAKTPNILPFILMALDNLVGWTFAALMGDDLGLALRSIACVLCAAYLCILVCYSDRKPAALSQVFTMLAGFAGLIVFLGQYVPGEQRKIDVLGFINTATAIGFAASPLSNLGTILKTRDASSISFTMVSVLSICALSWATYGAVLQSIWMVLPNALNFVLGIAQVGLVLALPSRAEAAAKEVAVPVAETKPRLASPPGERGEMRRRTPGQGSKEE